MYTNSYLQNVTQNLPLNYATIIFSLSSETKPRNTALQFIFIWIIISNFILCVISIYCILSILSHVALFVYIVYICNCGSYHSVLHCTIQPPACKSFNKSLAYLYKTK